jgi:hypothetical protein
LFQQTGSFRVTQIRTDFLICSIFISDTTNNNSSVGKLGGREYVAGDANGYIGSALRFNVSTALLRTKQGLGKKSSSQRPVDAAGHTEQHQYCAHRKSSAGDKSYELGVGPRLMQTGAVLRTYTCIGHVRPRLQTLGEVEDQQGAVMF